MNSNMQHNSFLLIDGAQLAIAGHPLPGTDDTPVWLKRIYDIDAAAVSPLLIDVVAAERAGGTGQVAALSSALQPPLHVSFIETTLSHEALAHHLRRFIMICTDTGKSFTLRFGDCTVLTILAEVLSPAQWAALVSPIVRWRVHGLDSEARTLPEPNRTLPAVPTPLRFSDQQLAALAEATAPSAMLAHLLDINHGLALPGTPEEQHRWASQSRVLWRTAGNTDDVVLRWLTSAALKTNGCVLQQRDLPALLGGADVVTIRARLNALMES